MQHESQFGERYDLRDRLWLDGTHGGYLALDRALGREVVINYPYRPDDVDRFLQRAQIRARLQHANLIPLYDLGATREGTPFFTEPYIEAVDIQRLCDDEDGAASVTLPRLVGYLRDACKAVAFLHLKGFLHLLLHPRNVLVVPVSNDVFVVRGHRSLPRVSMDSDGAFTRLIVPGYMAPEQVDPQGLGAPDRTARQASVSAFLEDLEQCVT